MQNIYHTSVLKYAQTVLRLIQSIMKYTAFTPRKKRAKYFSHSRRFPWKLTGRTTPTEMTVMTVT